MRTYQVLLADSPDQSTPYAKIHIFEHRPDGKCSIVFEHELRLKVGAIPEVGDDGAIDRMGIIIRGTVAALNQWHENECNCRFMIGTVPVADYCNGCHADPSNVS
jgi:hypothetical protein